VECRKKVRSFLQLSRMAAHPKDNTLLRQFCDCGQPATIKRGNAKICQGCADSKLPPHVVGRKRYWGAPTQREYSVRLGGWK